VRPNKRGYLNLLFSIRKQFTALVRSMELLLPFFLDLLERFRNLLQLTLI
jgi:hypothetical protein